MLVAPTKGMKVNQKKQMPATPPQTNPAETEDRHNIMFTGNSPKPITKPIRKHFLYFLFL